MWYSATILLLFCRLSGELNYITLCTCIRNGEEDDWDFVYYLLKNGSSPFENSILAFALTCTKDPKLIDRYNVHVYFSLHICYFFYQYFCIFFCNWLNYNLSKMGFTKYYIFFKNLGIPKIFSFYHFHVCTRSKKSNNEVG